MLSTSVVLGFLRIDTSFFFFFLLFSSPGRSPGRAIVLPSALVLASVSVSALEAASALAKC